MFIEDSPPCHAPRVRILGPDGQPPLFVDQAESESAWRRWKANCGPHALAAACETTLDDVRDQMPKFPGYTPPELMTETLEVMGVEFRRTSFLRTQHLCEGINWLHWAGPWRTVGEQYRNSHWVAHRRGWVLCSAIMPWNWIRHGVWEETLGQKGAGWHVAQHFEIAEPPLLTSQL